MRFFYLVDPDVVEFWFFDQTVVEFWFFDQTALKLPFTISLQIQDPKTKVVPVEKLILKLWSAELSRKNSSKEDGRTRGKILNASNSC